MRNFIIGKEVYKRNCVIRTQIRTGGKEYFKINRQLK